MSIPDAKTRRRARAVALAAAVLLVASCAHQNPTNQKPTPLAKAHKPTDLVRDSAEIAQAQRTLAQLGYAAGEPDGSLGPQTVKALRAFQKDQALPEDGKLTLALDERLKAARTKLSSASPADFSIGDRFLFDDGVSEEVAGVGEGVIHWKSSDGTRYATPANFFIASADAGLPDAARDFLQPLKPGSTGTYPLAPGNHGMVTCSVGHLGQTTVPAGVFDTIEASCHEVGENQLSVERRWFYAPALHKVVREETKVDGHPAQNRALIAVRPPTESWPAPARAGLDWAMTHALEAQAGDEPVQWSSTGVPERYAIRVDHTQQAPAAPAWAGTDVKQCLRYEVTRTAANFSRKSYPGLACQTAQGDWMIPGRTPIVIARPASGVKSETAATPKGSE